MRLFGLIGFPLSHSFSKRYFTDKFQNEGISDATYENFEIASIQDFPEVINKHPTIKGLNVTIPYKQEIIPFLARLDKSAELVGAVNVIKPLPSGDLVGFNSDYYGFLESLKRFLPKDTTIKALILGTGGAAKAVQAALASLNIPYQYVSRIPQTGIVSYEMIDKAMLGEYHLIVNTSPLGMYPNTKTCPGIEYALLTEQHYLFDLVYNPETTLFMQKGLENGAKVKNGLEMLQMQAEKAWEIWNN